MPKLPMIPTREKIEEALRCSLKLLYKDDHELLGQQGLEVSINSKLACYMQSHFTDWRVDAEYRREGGGSKVNSTGAEVQPDVIVHKRGPDGPNICVIEAKGHWNRADREIDRDKLLDYVKKQHYAYAYLIEYGIESGSFELVRDRR